MKRQRIDLDSESVLDYDINTALYTPLPEPKIMQVVRTKKNLKEGETVSGTERISHFYIYKKPAFSFLLTVNSTQAMTACLLLL